MIIAFLILYNYGASLLKYFGWRKVFVKDEWRELIFDVPTVNGDSRYSESKKLKFSPPLYTQRYEVVKRILKTKCSKSNTIQKVIDFGCAEICFFTFIKHMKGVQEYIGVDIDNELLNRFSCRVLPLAFDYLKKRTEPLLVQILCGSVTQPDNRLQNANVVLAIELIEHLYPDDLEDLPYNIFGLIQPEIAIFTTPNSEYNIFFTNFTGFRHYDHKFEWTREQFQSWANNLVTRYTNYKVVFGGVGSSPFNSRNVGYCTQIAVFFRNSFKADTSNLFFEVYKEIRKIEFPYSTEIEQLENIIKYEVEKFISFHSNLDCYQASNSTVIPLTDIHCFVLKTCSCTEEELRRVLTSCGWDIITLEDGTISLKLSYFGEEDLDNSSSSLDNHDQPFTTTLISSEEEDWDAPTFIAAMDSSYNASEKEKKDSGPSSEEIGKRESFLSSVNISSLQNLHHDAINLSTDHALYAFERAGGSSSSCSNQNKSNNEINLQQSSCSTCVKNENSEEKLSLFVKSPLQKCHSLESVTKENKINPYRFSLNIDRFKYFNCDTACSENSDLQKTSVVFSASDTNVPKQEDSCSQSKAADSGYPNSYGQDMDLDLTPEQVDEIITESESSFDGDVEDESGGEDENPLEIHGEIVRLGENVENGDVANNNRDGEGNNMEAVAAGGILQFEQVIAEAEVAVGNLAAAVIPADLEENVGFHSGGDVLGFPDGGEGALDRPPVSLQEAEYISVDNLMFPEWLVNILVDDLERNDEDIIEDVRGTVVPLENANSEVDTRSVISDTELFSDLELLEEPPLELIVQGDLMGGGEPPPIE